MRILLSLSDALIPCLILFLVLYGLFCRINLYDAFVHGARQGLLTVVKILPTLVGLMTAVGVLRASGFLDFLSNCICRFTAPVGLPSEIIPLALVKMFSSSAATSLLLDIFHNSGPDSLPGRTSSLLLCCTETIFYTMSVYFMTAKIQKSRYTLPGALLSTLTGLIVSLLIAGY